MAAMHSWPAGPDTTTVGEDVSSDELITSLPIRHASSPASENRESRTARKSSNLVLPLARTPHSPYRGQQEIQAHDFMIHWLALQTRFRSDYGPDLYTKNIPQQAVYFPTLRNVMIALGMVGASLARADDASSHHRILRQASEYTNKTVTTLSSETVPTATLIYVVWAFWKLDLLRGNLASSTTHFEGAKAIAAQDVDHDLLCALFVVPTQSWVLDVSVCPPAFDPANKPAIRKNHAVEVLRRTPHDISELILAVSLDPTVPPHALCQIIPILERCRSDAEWLLLQWSSDLIRDLGINPSNTPFQDLVASSVRHSIDLRGFFPPLFMRAFVAVSHAGFAHEAVFHLEACCASFLPQFLAAVAQDDLKMRQDGVAFMNYSAVSESING